MNAPHSPAQTVQYIDKNGYMAIKRSLSICCRKVNPETTFFSFFPSHMCHGTPNLRHRVRSILMWEDLIFSSPKQPTGCVGYVNS